MLKWISMMLGLFCLSGCSLLNSTPQPLQVNLQAAKTINPNQQGDAAPLVVMIYQLQDPTAFQSADFFNLYQQPKAALGESLLGYQQYVVLPDQSQSINLVVDPKTQFIGVAAAYRDVTQASWRNSMPLKNIKKHHAVIALQRLQITIE